MFRIGLKLWSTNTGCYREEAQRLYAAGLFQYIELYVVPGSLAALPYWQALDIPFIIHNAHFMHGFNLADSALRVHNREIYRESKTYADALNAPFIIFHGGMDGAIAETAKQLSALKEPRALIENKPFRALPNRLGGAFCRGSNFSELKTVMDVAGCGFCLDFGHAICAANSLRCEPMEYIAKLWNLGPGMFHLSDVADMASELDSHLHLGTGQLDLGEIIDLLPDNALVSLETEKSQSDNLDDFVHDISVFHGQVLVLRPAMETDMQAIFELSNDSAVRANSFSAKPIAWADHVSWFLDKIHSEDDFFLVCHTGQGEFCGQIRFSRESHEGWVVSFSLTSACRGRRLAARMLAQGMRYLRRAIKKPVVVIAWVKNTNVSSLRCFERIGFRVVEKKSEKTGFIYEMS